MVFVGIWVLMAAGFGGLGCFVGLGGLWLLCFAGVVCGSDLWVWLVIWRFGCG